MSEIEAIECDVVVLGAGVIGLAIASELSRNFSVIVIERFGKFGQETSSRNSEVVHSGIYYPQLSRKTEWCIAGRKQLYAFCEQYHVPVAKTGKYVVATLPEEEAYLEKLERHCLAVGVPAERKTKEQIHADERLISVTSGLYLPETGIVDSHQYMQALEDHLVSRGGTLAYRHQFLGAEPGASGWVSEVDGTEGKLHVKSTYLINAAGLGAAEISNRVLKTSRFEHRYCRGRYFSLSTKYQNAFKRLIYPVPPKDGLGIHITVDLAGQARLGPDVDWCENFEYAKVSQHYDCDWEALRPVFAAASRRYCSGVHEAQLAPGLIGIRPKLFVEGVATPDFLVENQRGFIHCLGIESPGLTSSLAIAGEVRRLVGA